MTFSDLALLDALTHRVRVFSLAQASRFVSARRLKALEAEGLVELFPLLAAEIPVTEPLSVWRPGEPFEPGPITYQARKRAAQHPVRLTRCVVATELACHRLAGHARKPRLAEGSHDLILSAAYASSLGTDRAERWRAEWWCEQHGYGAFDAMLVGEPLTVIEVVGSSYKNEDILDLLCPFEAQSDERPAVGTVELW